MVEKNKIAVYTSVYGGIDNVVNPPIIKGVDFILFSDKNLNKNWIFRYYDKEKTSHNLNAKRFKILPHTYLSEYDITIWVDGNVDFINLKKFIIEYRTYKMVVFNHKSTEDSRNCIYEEGDAIIKLKKDKSDIVKKQLNKYLDSGYPKNNGLICGGIIMRQNDVVVNNIMEKWWDEIINGSVRDQLSFNYVAWSHNFKPFYLNKDIRNNEYFKIIRGHIK